jgi:molybdopterin synthase catalytic subunit
MSEITTILLFATLKDRAGVDRVSLTLPPETTVAGLKTLLKTQFPPLEDGLGSALVSVNREFAFDEEIIPVGAEIALFPPVSGGGPPSYFAITEAELSMDELLSKITLPSTGAACFFTGMVRAETTRTAPNQTQYLEYETYQEMAEAKMQQVAGEIRAKWPVVEGIAIVQRVGRLYPGTPTVLIGCTAAHRDSGVFEAARYGIDRLKEIVPIWKKEVGPQGEAWIEGHYTPAPGE